MSSVVLYQHDSPSEERISVTFFLAAALHLIIIFGLSFTLPEDSQDNSAPTLEVTLSTSFTRNKVEDADFIGQSSQEGGGNIDDKMVPTAKEKPDFNDPTPKELSNPQQTQSAQQQQLATQVITTTSQSATQAPLVDPQPLKEAQEDEVSQTDLYSRAFEIASLEAEIDEEQRAYAKRPRKTFIRASVQEHAYAFYLKEWTDRIESVGNKRYPDQAKRSKLYGDVTVSVSIGKDGSLKQSRVVNSSGHKILDDAALRIVRLSAPFSPLPPEIRKETDILVITRVWEFKPGNRITTRAK